MAPFVKALTMDDVRIPRQYVRIIQEVSRLQDSVFKDSPASLSDCLSFLALMAMHRIEKCLESERSFRDLYLREAQEFWDIVNDETGIRHGDPKTMPSDECLSANGLLRYFLREYQKLNNPPPSTGG